MNNIELLIIENDLSRVQAALIDDVNIRDSFNGNTPLHVACGLSSRQDIAIFLIQNGADTNATNKKGQTPMYLAAQHNNVAVAQALISYGAKDRPLYNACAWDRFQMAEFLLDNGADVHEKGSNGNTGLHHACWNSNFELIQLLLDRGARIRQKNNNMRTPFDEICSDNNTRVAQFLINRRKPPPINDHWSWEIKQILTRGKQ